MNWKPLPETRCKYVHVRSDAASVRHTVSGNGSQSMHLTVNGAAVYIYITSNSYVSKLALPTLQSGRSALLAVNCAALVENLAESELFGHERGAFTGAANRHAGVFERASDGTLLLDEIGDMPLALQAKLLRVLQDRVVSRVGSSDTVHVDTRVVVATNQDLESKINDGSFREDLFYRINVVHLVLPPLSERQEDILWLAQRIHRMQYSPEPPTNAF